MNISCIMHRHQTGKNVFDYLNREMIHILLIVLKQFLSKRYKMSLLVSQFPFKHFIQRNTFKQFANDMIMTNRFTEHRSFFCLNEPQHLYQITMAKLNRRFPASFFYGIRRQVAVHKLDCDISSFSCGFINTAPLKYFAHSTLT